MGTASILKFNTIKEINDLAKWVIFAFDYEPQQSLKSYSKVYNSD